MGAGYSHYRRCRVDANQAEVVAALLARGWSVQSLASVGKGCPDLLVGVRGANLLLEVKDGEKSAAKRRLTEAEEQWHRNWRGQVFTVQSAGEAVAYCLCWEQSLIDRKQRLAIERAASEEP